MSNVKNFGLTGVGPEVQLGKSGAKLASVGDKIVAKNAAGVLTNVQAADPVLAQDVVTRVWAVGANITLGEAGDGYLSDGAVPLSTTTTVTNAVDSLNSILKKLVPASPVNFPGGQTLAITGAANALLASGSVPDNTTGGTLPAVGGSTVSRVTSSTVSSTTIGSADNVGPGDSGTMQAVVNGVIADSQLMSTGSNNKAVGILRISNDQAFPLATPGFWESFRSTVSGATATLGWNRLKLTHTVAGSTPDVYFVRDLTTAPTVTGGTVTESASGAYSFSSGIPHYGASGVLNVAFTASNLALETYSSGNVLNVSASNGLLTSLNYAPGNAGLSAVLARNMAPHSTGNLQVSVDGNNIHNSGQITALAVNPNATSTQTFGPIVLVKRGTTTRVDEMNIPLSIAINGGPSTSVAQRVSMDTGDTPLNNKASLLAGDWVSSSVSNIWEAAVVGGVLQSDKTNYSVGFLPQGPNRTAFDGSQYVTFLVRRTAVSKFNIAITGTYADIRVKLVDLSQQYTVSAGGWYSMSTLYGGAGFPGDTLGGNGSLGCALGSVASGTGSWTCTFGTLSSTNATNNNILVRIKLNAGQSITSLSFVPPTR